ncbi:MAG: sensor histidine kinase [Thermoplasmatota archaeon]
MIATPVGQGPGVATIEPLQALKVLIVEDDPDDVDRSVEELKAAGFDPDWRHVHTSEGFTASFHRDLDVVLSAYTLATIDPLWLLRLVRESGTGVPLIIVSGVIGDEKAAACLTMGATDYILKDRLARLGSAVKRVMTERRDKIAKELAEAEARDKELVAAEQARQVDRLRERNEFTSRFLSMVAHDLNNVVTPMRLNLHGLHVAVAKGELPEHAEAVELIGRNVRRMTAFLADLLDAARLQSGQLSVRPAPLDLSAQVAAAVQMAQLEAREAGLTLTVDLTPGLVVEADAGRVEQVLVNLLGNAIKFTPARGRVTVVLRPSEHGAQLSIVDSGIGLDKADMPRLFQPFSKLASSQGKHSGTGLGLFICRGIVESHGGRIWVESAGRDKGATVFVWLPSEAPPAGAPTAASH